MKIQNSSSLKAVGVEKSREIILDITNKTLLKLDSYHRIKEIMHLEGSFLTIGKKVWDLNKKNRIYLVGAGKACNAMAKAVCDVLGGWLTKGIIIVKVLEEEDVFHNTDVYVGGHPLPNEEGYRASLKILDLVDQANADDLFIAVMSGGSSALMSCPRKEITLQDEIITTDVMLKSGANIYEVNAIRRHISRLNGGMLAKRIEERGAELIGIGISDAVGNPPTKDISIPYKNYNSTPIGPDKTTLEDARNAIKKYKVENRLPKSVVDFLTNATEKDETPKAFPNNTYYLINTLADSCIYARDIAEETGINTIILTSYLEGESKDAGVFFASIAKEIQENGNPIQAPCIILSSGETTTKIIDNKQIKGHGGPSLELTVGFATAISKTPGACMLSIDSEGTDGTSMAAGGMTDSTSLSRAKKANVDLFTSLREHSTFEALSTIGDVVITGNTGTNLCDFNIMYVPQKGDTNNED
ncbi:glycerate kinase type-2 family protein [Psychrobacillus lasiicapitis]|nr:DUF4147 domain-containing protein [Psychrobacillus lasiicapitis]GGA28581.1 glycerate kinase [Psychrobacillus lasiicapitis]